MTTPLRARARHATLADLDDETLLALVRAGDDRAFGELHRRYEPLVRRRARSLVSSNHVDDVVSETFARVLGALRRGSGPVDHPDRYLLTTIQTCAYATYARDRRSVEVRRRIEGERSTSLEAPPPVTADPVLAAACERLGARALRMLWLCEVEGRTPAEIAREEGLTPNAVAAATYRARRALRREYDRLEHADGD